MRTELKPLSRNHDFTEITSTLEFRMDLKALELANDDDSRLSACKNLHKKYFSSLQFGYDRLKNDLQVRKIKKLN